MFKRYSLILLIGFCSHFASFGQIEGSNMIMSGGFSVLTFDCKGAHNSISKIRAGQISNSISDTNGTLLFFIVGDTIYDNNNIRVGKLDDTAAKSFLIIAPDPTNLNQYYIFFGNSNRTTALISNYFTIFTVATKSVSPPVLFSQSDYFEEAAKVPGRAVYWLIFQTNFNHGLNAYRLDSNGLAKKVYSKVRLDNGVRFYSDCSHLVSNIRSGDSVEINIEDFDNLKGYFNDDINFYIKGPKGAGSSGCVRPYFALSPDNTKFYQPFGCGCGHCNGFELYQNDISSYYQSTIESSQVIISNGNSKRRDWTDFIYGPDAKIYSADYDYAFDAINDPDNKDLLCNFKEDQLQPFQSGYGEFRFLTRQDYWPSFNVDTASNDLRRLIFKYNAPKPGEKYKWDFGDPSSGTYNYDTSSVTSHIFKPGQVYYVRLLVFQNGIHSTFTRMVCVGSSLYTNVKDTTVCILNGGLTFNAGNPGAKFLWSNGDTTQTTIISSTGKYWVRISNDSAVLNDTFRINAGKLSINLGPDRTICKDNSARFGIYLTGAKYTWSTGDTDSFIVVKKPGTYLLTVNYNGCTATDSVHLKVITPFADIGPDRTVCEGKSVTIQYNTSNERYLWSNGDTTNSINVSNGGKYWLRIDSAGCIASDTMTLSLLPLPVPLSHAVFHSCIYDSSTINLADTGQFNCLWQNGDTTHSITINKPGIYKVLLTASNGCDIQDSFIVLNGCTDEIFIPNSFTPNGNGHNDTFKAIGVNVMNFKMDIFNRWGEHIFSSSAIENGWDGNFKGMVVPEGIYLYVVNYQFQDQKRGYMSDKITVIR